MISLRLFLATVFMLALPAARAADALPGDPVPVGVRLKWPKKDHLSARELYGYLNATVALDKVVGQLVLLDAVVTIQRDVPLVEIVAPEGLAGDPARHPEPIQAHLVDATSRASSLKKGQRLRLEGVIVDEGYNAYMIYLLSYQRIK